MEGEGFSFYKLRITKPSFRVKLIQLHLKEY